MSFGYRIVAHVLKDSEGLPAEVLRWSSVGGARARPQACHLCPVCLWPGRAAREWGPGAGELLSGAPGAWRKGLFVRQGWLLSSLPIPSSLLWQFQLLTNLGTTSDVHGFRISALISHFHVLSITPQDLASLPGLRRPCLRQCCCWLSAVSPLPRGWHCGLACLPSSLYSTRNFSLPFLWKPPPAVLTPL